MFQVARGCAFLCGFGSPLIQPTRTVKNVTARLPRFRTKLFGKHGEFRTTGNGGIPPTTLSTAMSSSGSSMAPKASTYLTPGSFSSATADDCARSDRAPTMLPAIPALCPCLATWCRIYGRAFAPSPSPFNSSGYLAPSASSTLAQGGDRGAVIVDQIGVRAALEFSAFTPTFLASFQSTSTRRLFPGRWRHRVSQPTRRSLRSVCSLNIKRELPMGTRWDCDRRHSTESWIHPSALRLIFLITTPTATS